MAQRTRGWRIARPGQRLHSRRGLVLEAWQLHRMEPSQLHDLGRLRFELIEVAALERPGTEDDVDATRTRVHDDHRFTDEFDLESGLLDDFADRRIFRRLPPSQQSAGH